MIRHTKQFACIAGLAFTLVFSGLKCPVCRAQETRDLAACYRLAGENRGEIERFVSDTPESQQAAARFLVENMPRKDLESLSADFLLDHLRLAYEAREKAAWTNQVPDEVFLNDVLPYANVDETREAWRAKLAEICWPLVKDCKSTGEAAQELNRQIFQIVKVRYSTKRKKANQSPSESMEQGLASCTGLSILLVDACRSVNVPARLAGIPSWTNKRGNHTWVEVWHEDDWHFTGAAEYDANGLDRAWFTGDAALADKSNRLNSIYAISFARTDTTFPMVWSRDPENAVFAVNVTDRYTNDEEEEVDPNLIDVNIRVWNATKTKRLAMNVEIMLKGSQEVLDSGASPNDTADMNDMLLFRLEKHTDYALRIGEGENAQVHEFQSSDERQVLDVTLR